MDIVRTSRRYRAAGDNNAGARRYWRGRPRSPDDCDEKLIEPVGEAKDDYEIFSGIARRLGKFEAFTEGRSSREWLAFLYETTRGALAAGGHEAPDFETFWERGDWPAAKAG